MLVKPPAYELNSGGAASTSERGLTQFIAGDAWFCAIGLVVGVLLGLAAWRWLRDLGWTVVLVVLALGAGLTAAVYLPLVLHSALPDSTMPFAVLVLAACLLMTRLVRDVRSGTRVRSIDWRLVTVGVLIGLAALARNEAAWLGLAWAALV